MDSFIQSAHGKLKDAFRQKYSNIIGSVTGGMNSGSPELRISTNEQFINLKTAIKNEIGIDVEHGLVLEDIVSDAKEFLKSTVGRLTVETGVAYVAKEALALEGPLGVLLSEGVSIAGGEVMNALSLRHSFEAGEWCIIDIGLRSRMINQIPKVVEFASSFDPFSSESYVSIPDELDYMPDAKHTLGFFVSTRENGDLTVYSFEDGAVHYFGPDKIKVCPKGYVERLSENQHFSRLRASFFMKKVDPTLETFLPTSIGELVLYRGKSCKIIEAYENEYIVEQPDGIHVFVNSSELLPGNTEGTVSYDNAKLHHGSFDTIGQHRFFAGEWIWIPAQDVYTKSRARRLADVGNVVRGPESRILALVDSLSGNKVSVLRAYDGVETTFERSQVCIASDGMQRNLNQNKVFSKWKLAVLDTAIDPANNPPGSQLPYLSLGVGGEGDLMSQERNFKEHGADRDKTVKQTPGNSIDVVKKQLIKVNDKEQHRMRTMDDIQRYEALYIPPEKIENQTNGSFQVIFYLAAAAMIYIAIV